MPTWLEIVIVVVAAYFIDQTIRLRSELSFTEGKLESAQSANAKLKRQLIYAEIEIEKLKSGGSEKEEEIPAFLLADDPMAAIINDIGPKSRR